MEEVDFDGKEYLALKQSFLDHANQANRRKGEIPKDHPPPVPLIQRHLYQVHTLSVEQFGPVLVSHMPVPYPPCTVPASELQPIDILKLRLETHHRGSMIVVHVITPPSNFAAIEVLVADEKKTVTTLNLCYPPDETLVPAKEILRRGRFYLVKEPYFKLTTVEGLYAIRVDHLSDIVSLAEDDHRIPAAFKRPQASVPNSKGIRMQGNEAVGKSSWAEAARLYTSAIQAANTGEDKRLAYLNRSLANLRLGRLRCAASDAVLGGGGNSTTPSEKGLFREASALYQLAKFDECLRRLEAIQASFPSSDACAASKSMINRTKARLREQKTGAYDFRYLYKQAESTPPLIDCATYSALVEVRESAGRGRGLFITRKVPAGELLLCEKAFEYVFVNEKQPKKTTKIFVKLENGKAMAGSHADLLARTLQKLYHDSQAAREFGLLYHGDYNTVGISEVDGRPVIDTFLIEKIISSTAFGGARTTHATWKESMRGKIHEQTSVFHTQGVWPQSSYINHSCLPNCCRSFIGDMQIVRATKDMDVGTELFFTYTDVQTQDYYEDGQKLLEQWGFMCDCVLCLSKKSTPREILTKRKTLKENLTALITTAFTTTDVTSMGRRIMRDLENTYPATAWKPGSVQIDLIVPYLLLGTMLSGTRPLEAVEMILKALEASGCVITACPRVGHEKPQHPRLQVQQWGSCMAETYPRAFFDLCRYYETVAPELSIVAKGYAELAYLMVVGEKETFPEAYTEFK